MSGSERAPDAPDAPPAPPAPDAPDGKSSGPTEPRAQPDRRDGDGVDTTLPPRFKALDPPRSVPPGPGDLSAAAKTGVAVEEPLSGMVAIARQVVDRAKKRGAEVAEVLAREGAELRAKIRLGEVELLEEASNRSLALRVIAGGRSAVTYTSDLTAGGLETLVSDAIELMTLSQPDEHAAPPDPSLLARAADIPSLDLYDAAGAALGAEKAIELARRSEDAARRYDPRITNSEGASFSRAARSVALVTSGGFEGAYRGTYHSLSTSPVADDRDGKKRTGSYWDARRYLSDLAEPERVGEEAARRAVNKLGARKVETAELPVVFDPEVGAALLSLFFGCVDGHAVYRRTSYLCDKEGVEVASPLVTITDDPLITKGPGSRPFDGEGLLGRRNVVVEHGVLRTYLLDTYSARKLGRQSTASAARDSGPPVVSASNFVLEPGATSPDDIMSGIGKGLYVTSLMGFGFNAVTGDFSRGAEGFWIENGKRAFPIGEITISLNFNDLWKRVDAVGMDLVLKSRFGSPTFRVSRMTVAGT